MVRHTVIHVENDVEIVSGDVSADPQLQHVHGRRRFWVAVANDGAAAQRWAAIYRQYLADRLPQRHFGKLLDLLSEGVPKQRIIPSPRWGPVGSVIPACPSV